MNSIPKPARVEVRIDEPRVARGSVDSRSVKVKVWWREPQADSAIIAALAKPPRLMDVAILRRMDGGVELVPRAWLGMRFSSNKETFFEIAKKTPGGLGPVFKVSVACKRATELIRQYQPDFDSYAPDEQAEFVMRTIERLNERSRAHENLIKHLEYAMPGGRKAVAPLKDPERTIMAAILSDVHDLSTLQVGEKLRMPPPLSCRIKGENQTVRKMIDRGHFLLEQCFEAEGWRARVERIRAERERWNSIEGPEQQFYALLAEKRGTSPEEEERAAIENGFEKTLDEWVRAHEQDNHRQAVRIQLSDSRFDALERL